MRKFGEATTAPNNGEKLTIPVKTRTPVEAFKMLRTGQPVDVMAGYYSEHGMDTTDFHMKDKIGKLHALNQYREQREQSQEEINSLTKQLKDEQATATAAAERDRRDKEEISDRRRYQRNYREHDESRQPLPEPQHPRPEEEIP